MNPKTEELFYLLLWSCDLLMRPTWRNLTDSFECWAYRNGFQRQLQRLEKTKFVESKVAALDQRVYRLTEAGRLHALGGRDPALLWKQRWDGLWRMVLFDVPVAQGRARNHLRDYLRSRGFGYLQNSVWITPHPLTEERQVLARATINVESLLFLEARPAAGESDAEIVAGAWDFDRINRSYERHLQVLSRFPRGSSGDPKAATAMRRWAAEEREAWLHAVSRDPLLPECLLPRGYLGQQAWRARLQTLARFGEQVRQFKR